MLVQQANLEEKYGVVSPKNDLLHEELKSATSFGVNGKDDNRCHQSEIKGELKTSQINLLASLERNIKLKRNLVRLKAGLDKSCKWTRSSEDLDSSVNERLIGDERHIFLKKEEKKKMLLMTSTKELHQIR